MYHLHVSLACTGKNTLSGLCTNSLPTSLALSPLHSLTTSPTPYLTNTLSHQNALAASTNYVNRPGEVWMLPVQTCIYQEEHLDTLYCGQLKSAPSNENGRWNEIDDRSSMVNCSNQSTLLKATLGACDTVPQTGQSRWTYGRSHLDVRSSNGQVLGYMEQATSKCRELGT